MFRLFKGVNCVAHLIVGAKPSKVTQIEQIFVLLYSTYLALKTLSPWTAFFGNLSFQMH